MRHWSNLILTEERHVHIGQTILLWTFLAFLLEKLFLKSIALLHLLRPQKLGEGLGYLCKPIQESTVVGIEP